MLRRSTLVVVILFVVLLVIALYLQRNPLSTADESIPTSTPAPDLFSFGNATIIKLKVENQEGRQIELVKSDADNWEIMSVGAADTSQISSAVTELSTIKILSRLKPAPSLSAMGLEIPVNKITISLENNQVHTLDVGTETITTSGYYVRLDGGEPVVVSRYPLALVLEFLESPPLSPTPELVVTGVPGSLAETPFPSESPDSATKIP